jgi:hypothetical protein
VHHAEIFVQKNVAVKQERARSRRIAEIHPQLHAVVRSLAFPVGNFNRVPQIRIRRRFSVYFEHAEVNLMDVERMCFQRAVLDRPILNRADLGRDDRLLVRLEDFLLLPVDGDVELDGPVCPAEFL